MVKQLPDVIISKILERSRIVEYLESPKCNRHGSPYVPSTNGWNNGNVIAFYIHVLLRCQHRIICCD